MGAETLGLSSSGNEAARYAACKVLVFTTWLSSAIAGQSKLQSKCTDQWRCAVDGKESLDSNLPAATACQLLDRELDQPDIRDRSLS